MECKIYKGSFLHMSKKVFIIKNKKRRKISYLPKVKVRGNSDSKMFIKKLQIRIIIKRNKKNRNETLKIKKN